MTTPKAKKKNMPEPLDHKTHAQPRQRERPLSLLDLKGLGKELWTDVDAASHVDAECRSWD